jgi:SAM-dependent methyltransferase
MSLLDLVRRRPVPEPWAEGEKIPWHDPQFSRRMLEEHLSQEHDAASRRFEKVERHVDWVHRQVLSGSPTRILDLGCGPGFYASRLARLGHECVGIDFSPASIAYARVEALGAGLRCTYLHEDIRVAEYGSGFGLVMLIFGEFNVFSPADARGILNKARDALEDDGLLLLEPHTYSAVRQEGQQPSSWYSAESGLFSDRPHLCLQENFWDAERETATTRYFIIDAATGNVTQHASTMQAYTDGAYRSLLAECGFGEPEIYPSLTGEVDSSQSGLMAIVARKGAQPLSSSHQMPAG